MMARAPLREQALSLLAAANNHGDLAVKLSSLKQAKDVLLSMEASAAAELFPYLVELQSSPESLVRKYLIEVTGEMVVKAIEQSSVLVPILLAFLNDSDSSVAKQSILTGRSVFCCVLEELALQFHRRGIVERGLEELWRWMVKFKDAVIDVIFEDHRVGMRLLAIKFLETCVLLFTSDTDDSENSVLEASARRVQSFNISWVSDSHPMLNPAALSAEASGYIGVLYDLLPSENNLPGSLTISVLNSLAAIARKRPIFFKEICRRLHDFLPSCDMAKGAHVASIRYCLRTAFLGFLRSTHPVILESRDKLVISLRAMNAGDAADQVLRQVDKMMRNIERVSRDSRFGKEEVPSNSLHISGDLVKKRSTPADNDDLNGFDLASKRARYSPHNHAARVNEISHSANDDVNGISSEGSLPDNALNPVEQMIAMISALLAEGERGIQSLDLLISQIQPDLLADIVIANMRNLPKNPPPLPGVGNLLANQENDFTSNPAPDAPTATTPLQTSLPAAQVPISSGGPSLSLPDMSAAINVPSDSKRDPRRDPRRLDPRRVAVPAEVQPVPAMEDDRHAMQSVSEPSDINAPDSSATSLLPAAMPSSENLLVPSGTRPETLSNILKSPEVTGAGHAVNEKEVQDGEAKEVLPDRLVNTATDIPLTSASGEQQSSVTNIFSDVPMIGDAYSPPLSESDQFSPSAPNLESSEDAGVDLPAIPQYIDLSEEQQKNMEKLTIERTINSFRSLQSTGCKQMCMKLLAQLVAQIDAQDDVVLTLQKYIVPDYQQQNGHELVMQVLYHLHAAVELDSAGFSSSLPIAYEKFLLGVVKSLLETLPASDKSFSRILGEAPYLPDSVMRLLHDLCSDSYAVKDSRGGDRVTQGLGALWGLIVGRPANRQVCLDIALKCAVHTQDDIRTKAIRLVANKLYVLSFISEHIEQFATKQFLSAVDPHVSTTELPQPGTSEQRAEGETGAQEASVSGDHSSELSLSENDSVKGAQGDKQSDSSVSFAKAQCFISLFFALCAKKPSLLQIVFNNYACGPKAVKQAIHRHIPVLLRALGTSNSVLLGIISDPPEGSENLLTQVLQSLSEGTSPPSDLIATVKHLYETKLKDATILIPVLSSFSKNEVLPIFPRLVGLPLEKFQTALAHILQGSAHTGPALTPAEVLVAIHDISPERDGLPLKKVMDACSACFEQRTVFTQQVLERALKQMVNQTPLPLLFMRTVIQAIDAFPTMVDFVMEILSILVSRQVWRMPKLWVGFLKCVSQTRPHSFRVLLQLPPQQLESALNKHASLRGPLTAFANQPTVKHSIPRATLACLGLSSDPHLQQSHPSPSLHTSETSSVPGATPT